VRIQFIAVVRTVANLDTLQAQWLEAAALAHEASLSRDPRLHLEAAQLQRRQLERIEHTLGAHPENKTEGQPHARRR
jgi:hypothetical protein